MKPTWQATALALAVSAALGFAASDAQALALGRVTVQSALGEPLRADIDIPEINADEAASLRVVVASPETFRTAGLEYSPALANVQITLQRRADGRYFLRLASDRPVNDPFVDLILETNWSSGRIVRDYTMLFDPPSMRQGTTPLTAQVAPAPAPAPQVAATPMPGTRALPPAPAPRAAPPQAAAAPRAPRPALPPAPLASAPAAPAPAPAGEGKRVTVQSGDTATRIANAHRPASISLDQMLVAMLRTNPDAFVAGNVNRLRAGAVLEVPSAEQAGAVGTAEAGRVLVAQSRDFNEFRRRLAEGLPTAQVAPTDRQASGRVQTQVEEKKPGAATPDKLTLSKGAVQGKAAEEQIARQRAAQDAATRVAELNRNIAELNRLGTASPAAGGAAPAPRAPASSPVAGAPARGASGAAGAGIAVPTGAATVPTAAPTPAPTAAPTPSPTAAPTPAPTAAPTPAPTLPPAPVPAAAAPSVVASSAASAPAASMGGAVPPSATTPAPAAATPATPRPPAPTPAPAPVAEASLVDDLLENPLVPAAIGGAILAALLGFGLFKLRQRRKATQVDSSFLESRLQPDSFFGASGGQRVDTAEGGSSVTGSSMVYSPSQLDAAGDVDPVAEADVYLAYGRDLQAEEILKEALRINPHRVAIHAKLLEIYAKRRDAKAFEHVAAEAYNLTQGSGAEWERICELGQELDASNPLYRPGGEPAGGRVGMGAAAGAMGMAATQALPVDVSEPAPGTVDLDLDLDFSLGDDEPPAAPAAATPDVLERTMPFTGAAVDAPLEMDFGSVAPAQASDPTFELPPLHVQEPEAARLDAPDLTLSENSLNFSTEPIDLTMPPAAAPAPAAAAPDAGMIEFDLGALSLDLGTPSAPASPAAALNEPDTADSPLSTAGVPLSASFEDTGDDPLATKLALAEEFNAIGDPDGARSLAQEVLAEASGDLKSRAQRFLAEIG